MKFSAAFPEDLSMFLLNKCRLKEEPLTFRDAKGPLRDQDRNELGTSKEVFGLAAHVFLPNARDRRFTSDFYRYETVNSLIDLIYLSKRELHISDGPSDGMVKIGAVCPTELIAICEKGLLLLTITIPKIEHILWPFLLKMIIPQDYIGAAATIPKMKAYVSDTEDLKQDLSYQETWDDMIINVLWYSSSKVNDRASVCDRIDWMYKQADISIQTNRLRLAKEMGLGTNMLSQLLHVRHPTAKQVVITAIDLLGCAVIKAVENGASFPLKRRDMMLDYILSLTG
ncbi:hypothetical protein SO802_030565 [Lithocarpus litseifolius]|uniref:Uncharacterized protein n=1 Tax=Lithocarpus litseifolius TaxID=425828 RepID=A0AAW2BHX2_9ROSI